MRVFVLNTLGVGIDIINLVTKRIKITGVIGLSNREQSDSISDYVYTGDFCKTLNIPFIEIDTYSITKESDKTKILNEQIDVLVVVGWQRLIPEWLINHCSICVIGSHGSPLGITKGRGRSPQNWALILGMPSFNISIFKIDSGIDSGQIIDSRSFPYTDFDDIKTSYYKVCLLTSDMIIQCLQNQEFHKQNFTNQDHSKAEYFPQRLPQDGKIDWSRSNHEIRNFVRALTKPYPGAETNINDSVIKIWSVIPFEIDIDNNDIPGTIIKVFNKKDILVKTKNGFLLIDDYSLSNNIVLSEGMSFDSVSFETQMNEIIQRHTIKYPELTVSSYILNSI